jgi:hypothetical protein
MEEAVPHRSGSAWTELRSFDRRLLIPSATWEKALLPHIADYEAFFDTKEGFWTIPSEALDGIASLFEGLSEDEFLRLISGTQFADTSPTIDRGELISFLHQPGLRWRFVAA